MKKIKYQGGITKLITSQIGNINKGKFTQVINHDLPSIRKKIVSKKLNIEVVSFSSKRDFSEQVLSILSFLRFAGLPSKWTVYSDGTHTQEQVKILEDSFEFICLELVDWTNQDSLPKNCKECLLPYQEMLLDYAKKLPFGRRLYYYLNYKIIKPTLFLDSDILFYDRAYFFNHIISEKVAGWYLPEPVWGCLDTRYIAKHEEQLYQANGGFFLINREQIDLEKGMEFLKSADFTYEYFTDQNIFHIMFRSNGFMPLDPRIFVLDSSDQFDFSYLYPKEKMAIRHYTGPVRHKMWQRDWKWQLSMS